MSESDAQGVAAVIVMASAAMGILLVFLYHALRERYSSGSGHHRPRSDRVSVAVTISRVRGIRVRWWGIATDPGTPTMQEATLSMVGGESVLHLSALSGPGGIVPGGTGSEK